ncbi:MAG: phage tail tape measure protein, partial [Candidatus Competibacteraceae bacterium]
AKAGLAALVAGIVAMGAAFANGLRNAADFETVMARIQAAGVSSGAGAAQAAVGLEGLIKAGLSTSEAIGTLPNILALASGQMLAMDEATSLVIKTVNQFGLSFADSKQVVDTLATGANVAATSVQELAQGLENSGLEARKAGLSLQETVAALNTLMQNGQDAAGAGEALQSMLLELSDVSGPAREALRSVGVATGDFQTILALSR